MIVCVAGVCIQFRLHMENFLEVRERNEEGCALTEGVRHTLDVAHDIHKTIMVARLHGSHVHFHPVGVLVAAGVSTGLSHE